MAKKILGLGMVLVFALALAGCASAPAVSGFMDGNKPITLVSTINAGSSKTATLTSGQIWFGIIGDRTFPSISDTAKEGDITKIATVEYYVKPGILNLWVEYTTIVTGE